MARISFEEAQSLVNNENQNSVGFFSLKSDGEEAVVRFMIDDPKDFDILTVHSINLDGKYRKVSCVRDNTGTSCPLCNAGVKVESRFFIPLIQYTKDETGNIVAEAKIWERPFSYTTLLKSYINEYGPLSKSIFKVKRQGKPGDMKTKYDIMYGNPTVYREDIYKPVENGFEGYDVMGTIVLDKSPAEIDCYLQTGRFPETNGNNTKATNNNDVPFEIPSENQNNNVNTGVPYNGTASTPYGNSGTPWSAPTHRTY